MIHRLITQGQLIELIENALVFERVRSEDRDHHLQDAVDLFNSLSELDTEGIINVCEALIEWQTCDCYDSVNHEEYCLMTKAKSILESLEGVKQ